jgi:RNA polymerase sigma-70 factor, ECF subfamily
MYRQITREQRTGVRRARRSVDAQPLDRESRIWLEELHSGDPRRNQAVLRLYALLLREARFEVARRTLPLAHPSGGDLNDLAVQAAGDAVVSILAKLHQFRGDSLFSTWARRFVQREVPAKLRQRLGGARDLPMGGDLEHSRMWSGPGESPHACSVAKESLGTLVHLIADELTAHQREVLIALAIDGVPTNELATGLDTTQGALYKTLHDARCKLRAKLDDSLDQPAPPTSAICA